MPDPNPYAKYVEGLSFEEILQSTPDKLIALVEKLNPSRILQPIAEGKWTPAQILCHLADCELVFGFRLRQALAENNVTLQPFDQSVWAENYTGLTASQALSAFLAVRQWNLLLVSNVMPAAAHKQASHPERGQITFQIILETLAGHDIHHLQQLENFAR